MKASHVDIFKSDLKRPNKYFFCAPIFRIPPDATNSVCSVSGALLSAMMHKCKRSTSRYSCKVTLNSVPWIESFVKAAISLQITAEGNTVDKKTAFGIGLDYIQSFTCELALLTNGLLSKYLFSPLEMGNQNSIKIKYGTSCSQLERPQEPFFCT